MIVSLIVACGKSGQIGLNNKLLWHIPEDFKKFKTLTSGHTIIMGRNTFESLPGILPNRQHIVITSKKLDATNDMVVAVNSVEEALKFCKNKEKVWIIGGAKIYNYCIKNNLVDEFYISKVDYDGKADTYIDEIDFSKFKLKETETFDKCIHNGKSIPQWSFNYYKKDRL